MQTRLARSAFLAIAFLSAGARGGAITVWELDDRRGASISFDRAVPRLGDVGWNDRISSVRLDSGRWEICRDNDYSSCRILSAGPGEAKSLEMGWSDVVSSLRPMSESSEDSAREVAGRLYRAILGRDAEPEGLRNAAAEIERGRTESLVRGMIASPEYRKLRSQSSAEELLDQIHRGLRGRPADNAARRTYLSPIERGEDAQVILALLAADQYAGGTSGGFGQPMPAPGAGDLDLLANGAGLVVWGAEGRYESLSGAAVALGHDGRARIDLDGTTPWTLNGTWTRESDALVRLEIPAISGRRVDGEGIVVLDGERLARVEVSAGTAGARDQVVFTFVADDYTPARDETLCIEQTRAQLEGERGAPLVLVFPAPRRSSVSSGRDRLGGEALVLASPASWSYRCEVDTRRGEVLEVSIQPHSSRRTDDPLR
jgi:hypothetical protein